MKSEYIHESTIFDNGNTEKGLNQVLFYNQSIHQNQIYIAYIIIDFICKIALGLESCLHLNQYLIQNYVNTNLKSLNDFCVVVQNQNSENITLNHTLEITTRDFLKMAFAELGVEIEFSGKNQYEKGVIIDVDEDLANKFGLNLEILKQGQTVVKIDVNFNCLNMPQSVFLESNLNNVENLNLQSIIKTSIQTHLQNSLQQ